MNILELNNYFQSKLKDLNNELSRGELNKNELSEWHPPKSNLNKVTIIIHGLNLKPSRMGEIIESLTHNGHGVIRMALLGHRGSFEEQSIASWENWLNQVKKHYSLVEKAFSQMNYPIWGIGYSLGALLLEVFNQNEVNNFKKLIYIAPPFKQKPFAKLGILLTKLPENFKVKSRNLTGYRVNDYLKIKCLNSLFKGISQFNLNIQKSKNKNVETLIIGDTRDELVSIKEIEKMIKLRGLCSWKVVQIKKDDNVGNKTYFHLCIDSTHLGNKAFNQMCEFLH